jgi:hypothetical protein
MYVSDIEYQTKGAADKLLIWQINDLGGRQMERQTNRRSGWQIELPAGRSHP